MIHQYINNGYPIVLDVNSGSVHVMDEQAYKLVPVVEELLKTGSAGGDREHETAELSVRAAQILSQKEGKEILASELE